MNPNPDHISVCICTYKRPNLLEHLLKELQNQKTDQLFTYSIVVVDNDFTKSAESSVASVKEKSLVEINYFFEPEQNIALARNKAVQNAKGDFIAFIDDDEYPENTWLYQLYRTFVTYNVDGVLGPVKPHYDTLPPKWIMKGRMHERPSHTTGTVLDWTNTRTGNVLIKKNLLDDNNNMFRSEFGSGGEDRDFFRRLIERNHVFIWCNEAPVYETITAERLTRSFMMRRALLRGKMSLVHPTFGMADVFKSIAAVSVYTLILPVLLFLGHHRFMKYLIKNFDHIGRLLAICHIDVIKEKYVFK
jgi:succinoglycan biosynthesis protein ExoM